jgi:phospholipase D1/2
MGFQYMSICRGGYSIMETLSAQTVHGKKINPNDYSSRPLFSSDIVSFFNLRSFDRIAMSQQLKRQENETGITFLQADLALGLDIQHNSDLVLSPQTLIGYSPLPAGDALDLITHNLQKLMLHGTLPPELKAKQSSVEDFFGFHKNGKSTADKVHDVVEQFCAEAAAQDEVDWTVAQHALESKETAIDLEWVGDERDAVKNFVSEELYIHSKVMIVDGIAVVGALTVDRKVICGSANLNDRSMLGDRDSEVAVVVTQPFEISSTMDSKPVSHQL